MARLSGAVTLILAIGLCLAAVGQAIRPRSHLYGRRQVLQAPGDPDTLPAPGTEPTSPAAETAELPAPGKTAPTGKGTLSPKPGPKPGAKPKPKPAPKPAVVGPNIGIATQLLLDSGLSATLNDSTIFVPTDEAFGDLGLEDVSLSDFFNATLSNISTEILLLHVVPGVLLNSSDVTPGSVINVTSASGYNLTVTGVTDEDDEAGETHILVNVEGGSNATAAEVVKADIPFETNIVHVIDRVLLTPALEATLAAARNTSGGNETASGTDDAVTGAKRRLLQGVDKEGNQTRSMVTLNPPKPEAPQPLTTQPTTSSTTEPTTTSTTQSLAGKPAPGKPAPVTTAIIPTAPAATTEPATAAPGLATTAKPAPAAMSPAAKGPTTELAVYFLKAANISVENSTIFAPDDKAFAGLVKSLNLSASTPPSAFLEPPYAAFALSSLQYSVVPNTVLRAANIPKGKTTLPTLIAGKSLTVDNPGNGTVYLISSGNANPVKVLATDIPFGSNIVHVVGRVLLPGGKP